MTDRRKGQAAVRVGGILLLVFLLAGLGAPGPSLPEVVQAADKDEPKKDESLVPGGFQGRLDKFRPQLWQDEGGNAAAQAAVNAGLKWLARHQALDGHWGLHDFHVHGKCNCTGVGAKNDQAGTALALLAFLAAGETHKGTGKEHLYGKFVDRGLKWLIAKQGADGSLGSEGYTQALCTLVLCEAYGMTQDPLLKGPAQRAVNCCVSWQHEKGGFRYQPRTPGDLSVSSWFIQAIKSAQLAGLNVPNATLTGINTFLDQVGNQEGSGYGYQQAQVAPSMTAAGLLGRELMGWEAKKPGLVKGVEYLQKLPPSDNFKNMYYYYYATQVIHHLGGEPWAQWHPKMRDLLIAKQDQGTDAMRADQKGSWASEGDAWGGQFGRLGITSLSLLTLEAYVRHVPLYPRKKDDKKE